MYLSGTFGDAKILVFPNGFKKPGDKSPDYRAYVVPREKQEQAQQRTPAAPVAPAFAGTDEDMPF